MISGKTFAEAYEAYTNLFPVWGFRDTILGRTDTVECWVIPVAFITAYLILINVLPVILKGKLIYEKNSWIIQRLFFVWNCMLSFFSVIVLLGMIADGIWLYYQYDRSFLMGVVCMPQCEVFSFRPAAFYGWLFSWSKFFELGDTILTVLLFTWCAIGSMFSVGYVFTIMNAFIHSLMYYYYAAATLGYRMWWGKYLTMLQTSQMMFGMLFIFIWLFMKIVRGDECCVRNLWFIAVSGLLIYSTYLYLFIKFFIRKYL